MPPLISTHFAHQRTGLVLSALSLLFVGLACMVNVGGPSAPEADPVPTLEPEALADTWRSILSIEPSNGQVRLILTEQQLTYFLAARMADEQDPLLRSPQVLLREGEIRIYGVASAGPFEAGALVSIQPLVDSEGQLSFEVTSAEFGPLPVPDTLKESLSDLLTEAFTGKLGSLATGIRITSLAITNGEAAIVGELR